MDARDARSVAGVAQGDLRKKAVSALLCGMGQTQTAGVFGISRYSVVNWLAAYREGGEGALVAHRRGRRKGQGAALTAREAAQLVW